MESSWILKTYQRLQNIPKCSINDAWITQKLCYITGLFKTYTPHPQSKLHGLGWNRQSFSIVQLIWRIFCKKSWCDCLSLIQIRFFWKKVALWEGQGLLLTALIYPDNFLHCEISFNDRKMKEPILERVLIRLIGWMDIIHQI